MSRELEAATDLVDVVTTLTQKLNVKGT